MNGGVERDRGIAHELTRFLIRDNPDGARPTITDRLRAAALRDPWGETDTISSLVYAIVSGDWGAAALSAAVLLISGRLLVPLPYAVLRSIRGRA